MAPLRGATGRCELIVSPDNMILVAAPLRGLPTGLLKPEVLGCGLVVRHCVGAPSLLHFTFEYVLLSFNQCVEVATLAQ